LRFSEIPVGVVVLPSGKCIIHNMLLGPHDYMTCGSILVDSKFWYKSQILIVAYFLRSCYIGTAKKKIVKLNVKYILWPS
jgi:hypothetical protein